MKPHTNTQNTQQTPTYGSRTRNRRLRVFAAYTDDHQQATLQNSQHPSHPTQSAATPRIQVWNTPETTTAQQQSGPPQSALVHSHNSAGTPARTRNIALFAPPKQRLTRTAISTRNTAYRISHSLGSQQVGSFGRLIWVCAVLDWSSRVFDCAESVVWPDVAVGNFTRHRGY